MWQVFWATLLGITINSPMRLPENFVSWLKILIIEFTKERFILRTLILMYFLKFQDAYTFWTCSTQLPLWLLNPDTKESVQVEACRSTCLLVEKQCPFLIKGTEDDMASGNPSFICKGKDQSKSCKWRVNLLHCS